MGSNHIYIHFVLLKKRLTFCTFKAIPSDCFVFFSHLIKYFRLKNWNLRGGEGMIPQNEKLCQTILEKVNCWEIG